MNCAAAQLGIGGIKTGNRREAQREPIPILPKADGVYRQIPVAHRSPHVRVLGGRERNSFILPFRPAPHDAGTAGVSLSHYVPGHHRTAP